MAYSGAKKSPRRVIDAGYDNKNVGYLEQLTNVTLQNDFLSDFEAIKSSKSTKVLNKLFLHNAYQLSHDMETVASRIGLETAYIDMSDVETTQQHITQYMIDRGSINMKLCSVSQLTNATIVILSRVEFQGEFEYPCDIKYKKRIRFWTEPYRYKVVEAMHFQTVLPYAENCEMRVIVVPYNDLEKSLSLMIVLPNTIGGLQEVLKGLDMYQEKLLGTKFNFENVRLDIPVFTVDERTRLVNVLNKVGTRSFFL